MQPEVERLVDWLDRVMPYGSSIAALLAIVTLFVLALGVSRLAGLAARSLVGRIEDRNPARRGETALSLVQTSVRYLAFLVAVWLTFVVLIDARRIPAIAGASFIVLLIGFAAQRFLQDVVAGLVMFFERWFAVGDTILVEPWNVQGVVEEVSLRSTTLRAVNGDTIRVHNSQLAAVRVIPGGLREFDVELFVADEDAGRALVERVARVVPTGATYFAQRPRVTESECLDADLVRIKASAVIAPGREWLVEDFLPGVLKERAGDGLIVHGPIAMPVDEQATRRFARAHLVRMRTLERG